MFQRYFEGIQQARRDSDLSDILGRMAEDFGFRSGYIIEYRDNMSFVRRVLDSRPDRARAWAAFVGQAPPLARSTIKALVREAPFLRLGPERLGELPKKTASFLTEQDLAECVVAPITMDGETVGIVGFSGDAGITRDEEAVLPIIAYSIFAQLHAIHDRDDMGATRAALTNREREVLALSAEGMTSAQIARQLGMSPRTVNQHVDNVASKLGTRNRAHTVAEVIRNRLLE